MISIAHPDRQHIARSAARMLLEINAVHFRAEPFILTSGAASPVYIDCRKLISFPRIRSTLMDYGVSTVMDHAGFEAFDGVAGGETAGIPFAAWFAERMALPMQYVRKKPKGFGRDAQIEGTFEDGDRILLVEDLATDGGSKIAFVDAIRKAGFFYDNYKDTQEIMADNGLTLHYLTTWRDVLAEATEQGRFDKSTLGAVGDYLDAPKQWSQANGGK
ncbi:MAG: orotate phosphoribosyltransferase [Alphaproteobacteria bacterium]|nr:orotate phosphoribosyltransferase [Alphaproteobacteria bacterium]